MSERVLVCTPWHNLAVRDAFLDAWKITPDDPRILLREDIGRIGCGAMKNKIIAEAVERGAKTAIVLDSDCHPSRSCPTLEEFIAGHERALEPCPVRMFVEVTHPISRGTPHEPTNRFLIKPVAASMGFWEDNPDWDAISQIVYGADAEMAHYTQARFMQYFALSGMNLAFDLKWLPWCQFIDVPRMDDIWMGFLWQREAYRRGYCFNLAGPTVKHSRQSNQWLNLRQEAPFMEANETLWQKIHTHPSNDYDTLRALIPV